MQLQQPFDARQVEPASFPPPPPYGDYHVRIIESDAKVTKDTTGGYVELTLEILDPQFQGRKIPYRLNLFNQNQQTVEIAYRQLSAVCWVTGVFNVTDTRQLHNIPFIATIGPQKNDPQYANVFQVKDINGNLPGKAGQGQPAAASAPAPVAAQPPAWGPPPAAAAPPPAWGAMPSTHPAAAPAPPAPAPPPAWGPPPAAVAPAPAWQPPPAPAPPAPPAPAWQPQPAAAAPPPAAQPPWSPAAPAPAAPPWANK